jgi:hypothetical protein
VLGAPFSANSAVKVFSFLCVKTRKLLTAEIGKNSQSTQRNRRVEERKRVTQGRVTDCLCVLGAPFSANSAVKVFSFCCVKTRKLLTAEIAEDSQSAQRNARSTAKNLKHGGRAIHGGKRRAFVHEFLCGVPLCDSVPSVVPGFKFPAPMKSINHRGHGVSQR